MEKDITASGLFISQLHQITYDHIRARCRKYFTDLVPGKNVDLVPVGASLDEGLKFVLCSTSSSDTTRNIEELSGGQKSLLSLSYVFACALNRPSPLYLMDEIDAALDERNQNTVASIIASLFKDKMLFCVSHHPDFQAHATEVLTARMADGCTLIVSPRRT